MIVHHLKTHPQFWPSLLDGSKPFEIRLNDRKYHVGDLLILKQYDPKFGYVNDGEVVRQITYICYHEDFPLGVTVGYVVLGLGIVQESDD